MRIRTPLAIGAATLAAVTAGVVVTTPQTASSAAPTKSYAWGLSVNGEGQQPYVESTDGSTQTNPDATLPDNPIVSGEIAKFQAGDDYARIQVANLTIGSALDQLPQEAKDGITELQQLCEQVVTPVEGQALEPILGQIRDNAPTELQLPDEGAVTEFCNGLLDADVPALAAVDTVDIECDGDTGRMSLAGTTILGAPAPEPLQGDIPANTKLFAGDAEPLAQAVQVTFNRQTKRPNGAFDVDGVVVELGGGQGEIILGHTTCGEPLPRKANAPAPAPAPDPVRRSVPVTG